MRRPIALLLLALAVPLGSGCGGQEEPPPPPAAPPAEAPKTPSKAPVKHMPSRGMSNL